MSVHLDEGSCELFAPNTKHQQAWGRGQGETRTELGGGGFGGQGGLGLAIQVGFLPLESGQPQDRDPVCHHPTLGFIAGCDPSAISSGQVDMRKNGTNLPRSLAQVPSPLWVCFLPSRVGQGVPKTPQVHHPELPICPSPCSVSGHKRPWSDLGPEPGPWGKLGTSCLWPRQGHLGSRDLPPRGELAGGDRPQLSLLIHTPGWLE